MKEKEMEKAMKRRTFLKWSSLGLGAALVGAGGTGSILGGPGDEGGGGRIYGLPESVRPRPPLDQEYLRLSLARTDLPPETWREVAALALLAQDVFDNPEVAAAFARSPRRYLRAIGLGDVRLAPEAVEVKIALAIGDPEVRGALERNDPAAFLQALEARGLLDRPEPSLLAHRLAQHLETVQTSLGPGPSPEACSVLAICIAAVWIWVGIVQDAVALVNAAAAVNVYAYALVYTKTEGPKKKMIAGSLYALPSFRLASVLGGPAFCDQVTAAFIEDNVEKVAQAVEGLKVYRERSTLSAVELRGIARSQMIRQLTGHTVPAEDGRL